MSGPQFDTTGEVFIPASVWVDMGRVGQISSGYIDWKWLDAFTRGYTEGVLRAAEDTLGGFTICGVRFTDFAPETLARIIEDCERYRGKTSSKSAAVGALFWKNRAANCLSDDGWMPLTVTLGDDGKVRFAALSLAQPVEVETPGNPTTEGVS